MITVHEEHDVSGCITRLKIKFVPIQLPTAPAITFMFKLMFLFPPKLPSGLAGSEGQNAVAHVAGIVINTLEVKLLIVIHAEQKDPSPSYQSYSVIDNACKVGTLSCVCCRCTKQVRWSLRRWCALSSIAVHVVAHQQLSQNCCFNHGQVRRSPAPKRPSHS